MPGDREDEICQKALELLSDLCSKGEVQNENCLDFIYHFRDLARPRYTDSDVSVSLLSLVVTACGLALFGVSIFVSWKLCWIPWRERGPSPSIKAPTHGHHDSPMAPLQPYVPARESVYAAVDPPVPALDRRESHRCSIVPVASGTVTGPVTPVSPPPIAAIIPIPEAAMKISHTSPDIPLETQSKGRENGIHTNHRTQRQTTEPSPYVRSMSIHTEIGSNSIRRLSVNRSNPDFNVAQFQRQDSLTGMGLGLGRLKPELYKQRSLEGDEGGRRGGGCGRLHFILKFDCDLEQLIVKIHKAQDLPAKDLLGTSDPYVKIYLLPDRQTKHQTKVHRKTLNPVFDEVFLFPVEYAELPTRKLHFSVYDFDRFSRHDIIGQVVVDNFLDLVDFPAETKLCRDIQYVSTDNVDLGDLMFSLCYLPTAGRLTITMIKARNLKAMDITGASDPYVKVSLMCDGRRLKKRKTSTKRNTLNPVYNEAIVFDVPPENIDQIGLMIAVMDYDRVGHNEVIGVCKVGTDAEHLGRDHWSEMLSYPRKPIAHWHPLIEYQGTTGGSQAGSCNSLKTPPSP
ncbi:synaptotagmin-9-like [Oncorhynchus keta]|uniref:synaptotagmin-9-like n=1 Tax=Oncorhynchus keta TaxID=8018 RepID=UPI0015F9DC4B|nr:synaptotagmin-9-like [Oncorhynchus keta]